MPILDAGAAGDDIFSKKSVFLILGILVERIPEQIRSSGVDRIVMFIKEGLSSDHPILLNGAIFTFAHFVEHLKVNEMNTNFIVFLCRLSILVCTLITFDTFDMFLLAGHECLSIGFHYTLITNSWQFGWEIQAGRRTPCTKDILRFMRIM